MNRQRYDFVLSIYPTTRGFSFTLFEGPLAPVDWGITELRGPRKNQRCLKNIRRLLVRFQPDVLVLQDTSESGTRRVKRIVKLNSDVRALAEEHGLRVEAFSRPQVRAYFMTFGVSTKDGIAEVITKHVPAFARYLPPARKPWASEDSRMGLFDSASLALTFFQSIASPPSPET